MTTGIEPPEGTELAAVRAERDQLQADVAALRGRRGQHGWWRQAGAAVLVLLACVSLTASVVGVWARRNFLDTDRFTERAGSLIDDPAVQEALTVRLTDQLMELIDPRQLFEQVLPERGQLLAAPLANAVEGFVQDRVASFVATEQFARLWTAAVRVAHETSVSVLRGRGDVVSAEGGQVTLNLVPVVVAVLGQITASSPEILGRQVDLPDVTGDNVQAAVARVEQRFNLDLGPNFGQFTVYDHARLEVAQRGIELFDRLAVLLVPLGLAFAAAALWISRRRRRTLLQLATGLAIGMVLLRRGGWGLQDQVVGLTKTSEGHAAVTAVVAKFLDPLTTFALWTLWAILAVIAVAVLTAEYPWVVSLRRRARSLWAGAVTSAGGATGDDASVAWVRRHRDALLIGGVAVGVVVLWDTALSWFGVLLVLGLVAAFELVVRRIGGEPSPP